MIEFKDVSYFNKDGDTVLKNVSFTIKKGEYTVIAGKNGTGKSTIIKLIAGLLKTDKGVIEIDGRKLEYYPEVLYNIRKKIGVVFHTAEEQLIGETVLDGLIFGMENNNMSSREMKRNIEKYTRYFNIGNLLSRKISTLSGGEKQKIALISAIITEPEILIMDEGMENIDIDFREIMGKFFDEFLKEEKTIVSVSHDPDEIKKSDRIILISENSDIKIGKFKDVMNEYDKINNIRYEKQREAKLRNLLNENIDEEKTKIKLYDVSYFQTGTDRNLINNLTVSIPEGEITAIIGKTGIGKTTLIELIYGLYNFDDRFSGEISFCFSGKKTIIDKGKESLKEIKGIRRNMAIVFQNMESQFFESTVWKEIEYNVMKKYKFPKNSTLIGEKIKEAVKRTGLDEKYLEKSPFLLSDGEKRLVGIAMAISTDPEILFLDEPTSSLDYSTIKKIMELLEKLKKEGVTIILVTHDHNIVEQYADNYIQL